MDLFSRLWTLLPITGLSLQRSQDKKKRMVPPTPLSESESDEVLPLSEQNLEDIFHRTQRIIIEPGLKRISAIPFPPRHPSDEHPTPPRAPPSTPTEVAPSPPVPSAPLPDQDNSDLDVLICARSPSMMSVDVHDEIKPSELDEDHIIKESPVSSRPHGQVFLRKTFCKDEDLQAPLPRRFYFFISTMNLWSLRTVARELSVPQGCLKAVLIARVFKRFMQEYTAGVRDVSSLLSIRRVKAFDYFTNTSTPALLNQEMPTVEHLESIANTVGNQLPEKPHPTLVLPSNRTLSNLTESVRGTSKSARCEGSEGSGQKRSSEHHGDGSNRAKKVRYSRGKKAQGPRKLSGSQLCSQHREEMEDIEVIESDEDDVQPGDDSTKPRGKVNIPDDGGDDEDSIPDADVAGKKAFTDSEFVRLLLLFRDDEHCRSALFASTQPFTRIQLDSGVV